MLRLDVRSGAGPLAAIGVLVAALVAALASTPAAGRPVDAASGPTSRGTAVPAYGAVATPEHFFAAVPGANRNPRLMSPAQATPSAVTVIEDFEHEDWPDPALWEWDMAYGDDYLWAPRTCRASSGDKGLWAVGGGDFGKSLGCRRSYPADVRSVVYLNLDLVPYAGANPLELVFDIAADLLSDSARGDWLSVIYRRPDPEIGMERVPVIEWTGATGPSMQFQSWRINLLDMPDKYDQSRRYNLAGQKVQFEFMFRSADDSDQRGEGPHLDRIRLEYGGIAAVAPTPITPWPTVTPIPPTPTISPTPSQTLTPSATPTASRIPPDPKMAALPLMLRSISAKPYTRNLDWLHIGQPEEPDTLYLYAERTTAMEHLFGAIYDGPVDVRGYEHYPVVLTKLPSIEADDGSVRVRYVTVQAGERYLDQETDEIKTATELISNLPQMRVQFEMRSGVLWEDGTEVTPEDSVLSQQIACNGATPGSKHVCERTAAYVKQGEHGVEWQGLPGFADPGYVANFYPPLPAHQLGAGGKRLDSMSAAEALVDPVFARSPYAYGPFRIANWLPGQRIVLDRNPAYWRGAESLPRQPHAVFHFEADPDELLDALYERRIDVVTHDGLRIGQFDELEEARSRGRLTPRLVAGSEWEHIDFNLNPGDARVAVGACAAFRRAVAFGTNRALMVRDITRRHSTVLDTFVMPEHWARAPASAVTAYPYDPDMARGLLDTLGFRDADGDGVREAPSEVVCSAYDIDGTPREVHVPAGTTLALTLRAVAGDPVRDVYTAMFQTDMAAIGVRIALEMVSADMLYRPGAPGVLYGRRYDLVAHGWQAQLRPDALRFACDQIPRPENEWSGRNATGYCDPAYDALVTGADAALERAEAVAFYHQIQALWSEALPVLPMFQQVRVAAISPNLTGFSLDTMTPSETWDIESWENGRTDD